MCIKYLNENIHSSETEFNTGLNRAQQTVRRRVAAMGQAPVWKLLMRFSGPAILSMVVAAGYTVVDAIFIGRLGPEALGALSVVFPPILMVMALSMGTGVGAASFISRSLGAGNHDSANRCACTAISLAILVGVLAGTVYLSNLDGILRLFGATDAVLPPAKRYLSILATFACLHSAVIVIGNLIRAEGSPVIASTAVIVSALTNIILDPILIFGFGPIPRLEVAGAALATVISHGIAILIFLYYFLAGRSTYSFGFRKFLPNKNIISEIYRVGFASIFRMGALSVVMALANTIAASFGVIPLAVLGVVFRLARIAFMPTMGLGQGMQPLVGFNFGANQNERVGEVVVKAGLLGFGWGLFCWLIFMIFPSQVMSAFNSDPRFIAEGVRTLRIFVLLFFAVQAQILVSFFFQGIGKAIPSLILASARQVIFLVPGLLILPRLFGVTGLWIAFPVADVLSMILTFTWIGIEFRNQGMPFQLRYA
jgi:putative MATE family efflux protein